MDFSFTVKGLLDGRKITTSIWDKSKFVELAAEDRQKMKELVDTFGIHSAQAQGLNHPVTDYNRIKTSDQQLILICKPHWVRGIRVIGGLKCGNKHLFFRKDESFLEAQPMCVLDFYVHEKYQHKGYGKKIFQTFLKSKNEDPSTIAYDRPSTKLLSFLKKHYGCPQLVYSHLAQSSSSLQCSSGMTRSIQHNNNYAVFESFLENIRLRKVKVPGKRTSRSSRSSSNPRSCKSPLRQTNTPSNSSLKDCSTDISSLGGSSISNSSSSLQISRARRSSSTAHSQKHVTKGMFDLTSLSTKPKPHSFKTTKNEAFLTRMPPPGPYPGFKIPELEETVSGNKSGAERPQATKEPYGLTRLAPIIRPDNKEDKTSDICCIPPWDTGFSREKKVQFEQCLPRVFPTTKAGSRSEIKNPSTCPATMSQIAYTLNRKNAVNAAGVKNCLCWGP